MKTSILAVLATALLFSATGCSDPCGDIKDCCVAVANSIEGADASACNIYDEADDDACQAAIDAYQAPEGADLPDECNF
jgi:hypothetical protein